MDLFQINVLAEILKFLDPRELAAILRTSKSFYTYGTVDSIWKHYCNLLFPYYVDSNYYNYLQLNI